MNSFKIDMDKTEAEQLLNRLLKDSVTNVVPIDMGELSRVFSFEKAGEQFVIHFREDRATFDKAKLMHERFGSPGLPIPKVIQIGTINHYYFAISEKAAGQPVSTLAGQPGMERILIDLAGCFTRMGQLQIDPAAGFGWISADGRAASNSWKEHWLAFFAEDQEGFHYGWTQLYKTSFLEQSVLEKCLTAAMELVDCSPNVPQLIHGDFHLGNMLSDGSKITAIIDWELSMYGDFVLDLATMHFWWPQLQFPQRVRNQWLEEGRPIPYFDERIRCYLLFRAADALRFYAKKDEKGSYLFIKDKIKELFE